MTFIGYIILSIFFSSWIYPVAAHWTFGTGWLKNMGYKDLAGCASIHMLGGMGALMCTIVLKPRADRWNPKYSEHFEPSNIPFITLACLSLYVCWMYFNAGAESVYIDNGHLIGLIGMNTFISGAAGALSVFIIFYIMNSRNSKRYSLLMLCNGNLAGLVAITGMANHVEPWAAAAIGTLAGGWYLIV